MNNNILCLILQEPSQSSAMKDALGKFTTRQYNDWTWFIRTNQQPQELLTQIRGVVGGSNVIVTRVDTNGFYPDELRSFFTASIAA